MHCWDPWFESCVESLLVCVVLLVLLVVPFGLGVIEVFGVPVGVLDLVQVFLHVVPNDFSFIVFSIVEAFSDNGTGIV